jgi:[ribosomal protein S5]-alanine N-acetyltransferase
LAAAQGLAEVRTVSAEGLLLEPQLAEHSAEMFRVLVDPAIYEFEREPPSSPEALRARFARLESRKSPDRTEDWLNWVVRLPSGELAGYVQATVRATHDALISYELASAYWHLGIGSRAVSAMLAALAHDYGAVAAFAVVKQVNHRSRRLLVRQGFQAATGADRARFCLGPDEVLMTKKLR